MSRSQLRLLAVVLSVLIVVVAFHAFDRLPGSVRTQIDSERSAVASAQKQLSAAQDTVARELQEHAALLKSLPASQQWTGRFSQAAATLQSADAQMRDLTQLEKDGHYEDRAKAQNLLATVRGLRNTAQGQVATIQADASRFIERANHLPAEAQQMERDYHSVQAFDLAPLKAAVARAESDWPEKKSDLDARLASVTGLAGQADSVWQSTAKARAEAAAGPPADFDAGAFLTAGDELRAAADSLPKKSAELQALTSQLYDVWDKILVDMQARGSGSSRDWQQKIRTVRTRLADASAKTGSTTSQEQWASVPQATFNAMRNNLGMAVEHKSAGKYDFEAEHVAEPAGFAYMAPPSQGSNQYGYWNNSGGQSFWVWYGQYALLRDLLFNHSYRPLPRDDWEGYRTYRDRGQTYYGRDYESQAPRYGTNGTTTQDRYAGSTYGKSGGFRDSPYASKSGSYRDSPYATPGARNPGQDSSPRTFGNNRGSAPPERGFRPPPSPSYRPTPSFRPPPSAGRRFGGRR
jgi:hypothetical protein